MSGCRLRKSLSFFLLLFVLFPLQLFAADLFVSVQGGGDHSGRNALNPLSKAEFLVHLAQSPNLEARYILSEEYFGDLSIELSQSATAWKEIVASKAEFGRIHLQPSAPGVPLTGYLAFHGVREALKAKVELDYVFFYQANFTGGPLTGDYRDPSSYSQETGLAMNANYVACIECQFTNFLMGVVSKGVNLIASSNFSYIAEDAIRLSSSSRAGTQPQVFIFDNLIRLVGANHNRPTNPGHPDFIQGYSNVDEDALVYVAGNVMTNTFPNGTIAELWTQGIFLSAYGADRIFIFNNVIDTRHATASTSTGKPIQILDPAFEVFVQGNTFPARASCQFATRGERIDHFLYIDNLSGGGISKGSGVVNDTTNHLIGTGSYPHPSTYISPAPGTAPSYSTCEVEFAPGTFTPINSSCSVYANASNGSPGYVGAFPPNY